MRNQASVIFYELRESIIYTHLSLMDVKCMRRIRLSILIRLKAQNLPSLKFLL